MTSPDLRQARPGLIWLWLSILVLIADQATKLWVMDLLEPYQGIPVAPFFNLVHVHNTGAAFSLFADQPGWQRGFFIVVAAIAASVILWLLQRTRGRPPYAAALALILGGAIGNLVDRISYGHVIDFLDFYAGTWHWPAFNIADTAITIGAGLLIWDSMQQR